MKRIHILLQRENIAACVVIITTLGVYCSTVFHGIGITDAGELASVLSTLGIAHPTGYPLFTLLGHVWSFLPLGGTVIYRLNVFSALMTALASGLFFKATLQIHRCTVLFVEKKKRKHKDHAAAIVLAAAAGSFVLAFSTTFWTQSTSIEVYALHLVLLLLSMLFFLRGIEEQCLMNDAIPQSLLFFAFILGLSFCNHMTTVLLMPAFAWLYFTVFPFQKQSFVRLLYLLPFFLLGLTVYLYFPIRSAAHPLFDWGHPATVERIFWHISGKQFRVWMFSGWDVMRRQFGYLVNHVPEEFYPAALGIIGIGCWAVWTRSRRLFWFLGILALADIGYAINYNIFDIDSYFLLFYIVCSWLFAFGLHYLYEKFYPVEIWKKILWGSVVLAIVAMQYAYNRVRCNELVNKLPEEFVQHAYEEFEPHAIVFCGAWDYFISPSWYEQVVGGKRPDLTVIDKSLLQDRSWYYIQLQRTAPEIVQRSREVIDAFLEELSKFEHDEPFDGAVIQARWSALLADIVERSLPDHPVYVDARIMNEFPAVYHRVPSGLFFKLEKNTDSSSVTFPVYHFSSLDRSNPVGNDFAQYYSTVLGYEVEWCMKTQKRALAIEALQELLRINPQNYYARQMLAKMIND